MSPPGGAGGLTDPVVPMFSFARLTSVTLHDSVCTLASEGIIVHCCDREKNSQPDGHSESCAVKTHVKMKHNLAIPCLDPTSLSDLF